MRKHMMSKLGVGAEYECVFCRDGLSGKCGLRRHKWNKIFNKSVDFNEEGVMLVYSHEP